LTTPSTKAGNPGFDQLFTGKAHEGVRVRTGIVELDEMLHGGFMEGDAVMVAGAAGCGKTTLALQYLVNGVRNGDPGVYVTFEEMPDQIYRDAKNFGWDLRKLEEQNKFKIICTSPTLLLESDGETLLDESFREIQPKRIVVDSLSHLAMFVKESELRREAYRLIMHLKTRGISSVLIWESPQMTGGAFSVTEVGLSFLVDCILALKPVEIESSLRKAIAILKMRGSDHDKHLREFQITPNGIKIESAFADYEGLMGGSPRKVPSEKFVDLFRGAAEKKR
jgi:circadian clock protein KaiC